MSASRHPAETKKTIDLLVEYQGQGRGGSGATIPPGADLLRSSA